MKIKLSKSQWEQIGRKTGWMRTSAVNETPEQAAKRISEFPGSMKYSSANDIFSAADGEQESLQMLKQYYPTWGINEFKRCKEVLNQLGID